MDTRQIGSLFLSGGGVLVGGFGAVAFPNLALPAVCIGVMMVGIGILIPKRIGEAMSDQRNDGPAGIHSEGNGEVTYKDVRVRGFPTGIRNLRNKRSTFENVKVDRESKR